MSDFACIYQNTFTLRDKWEPAYDLFNTLYLAYHILIE